MRSKVVVESNNIFKLPVRRNQEGFEIRVHQLKGLGSTSFVLWESSIGHLAKSTSRANTILSRKVDLREALHVFLRVVSQSVDLGWSNNPNTTPTKDYEIVQVVVYLRGVQRGCAEEGERGSTPTG